MSPNPLLEKSVLFDDCNQCCFYKIFILTMFTCMCFSVGMCIHVSILRKARDIGSSSAQVIGTYELYNTCVVNWTLDLYENNSSSSLLRYLSHPVLDWRRSSQHICQSNWAYVRWLLFLTTKKAYPKVMKCRFDGITTVCGINWP